MPRYLNFRFDITALTPAQVHALRVAATLEPAIPVAEVCHFCNQVVEHGQCGGAGEGTCTELACASGFDPAKYPDVETYVIAYCKQYEIEDTLLPYNAKTLTLYQQLAHHVREYNNLPQPKR